MIEKITNNIEILVNGGTLTDENGVPSTFSKICLDDGVNIDAYTLEEFSELIEHVVPKTEREIELEAKIAALEQQLAVIPDTCLKERKSRVTLSQHDKLEISKIFKIEYTADPKLNLQEFAKRFDISAGNLTKFLKEFGVYEPGKKIVEPNGTGKGLTHE